MPRGKRLDPAILEAALSGLQQRLSETERQIAEVKSRLRGSVRRAPSAAPAPAKPKRTMSAAARRRIAAAQKRRWAEFRAKAKKRSGKAGAQAEAS